MRSNKMLLIDKERTSVGTNPTFMACNILKIEQMLLM